MGSSRSSSSTPVSRRSRSRSADAESGGIRMSEIGNPDRRRFLGTAAMTLAAARLGMLDSARAGTSKAGTNTSFVSLKHIDAGVLNVGYVDTGPPAGTAVVLLHGWPYDIHSFLDVVPMLASSGYRVIVPHLR